MLPDNFDFAMLPVGASEFTLKEIGLLSSTIETIDMALVSWIKEELNISVTTNEGFTEVPVLWQTPERAFQIKNKKDLRDDAGALKLPLMGVERTGIVKDPTKKGAFQAHYYSKKKNGRSGRWVIAKKIAQEKTRNFASVDATRGTTYSGATRQKNSPRINKKIVIKSLSIPIPVYVNLSYKITLKSEYQQQMNNMLAPFIARTGQINAFVMRRNGHLYEGFIDQNFAHNNNIANLAEEVRMFNSEITITVLGYLIGEGESDDRPIVRVDENIVEVTFPQEEVTPIGIPNIFGDVLK
jgi:hypothetical protein